MRHSFDRMIRRGEETLHQLCELLCSEFFDGKQLMHSVVVGEVESHDRFTLVQSLTRDDLRAHTDLDLGTRQLQRFRYTDGSEWKCAALIANFVEYQPLEANRFRIHKLISRIKAEEQIWNKVVDGLFGLERLVLLVERCCRFGSLLLQFRLRQLLLCRRRALLGLRVRQLTDDPGNLGRDHLLLFRRQALGLPVGTEIGL